MSKPKAKSPEIMAEKHSKKQKAAAPPVDGDLVDTVSADTVPAKKAKKEKVKPPPIPTLSWMSEEEGMVPLLKALQSDLHVAATTLGPHEVRYLVDLYYSCQEYRKATGNQYRAGLKEKEPMQVANSVHTIMHRMEMMVATALRTFLQALPPGPEALDRDWLKSTFGVGPVLTAGFLATIDFTKAPLASSIWRFAGLDPSKVWNAGEKRPWNPRLKKLWWLWADVQWKLRNNKKSYYGPLMEGRKKYETEKNIRGDYADQAEAALHNPKKVIRDADLRACLESGRLPLGQIQLRAYRWTAKLFFSHYYEVARIHRGLPVIRPWILGPGGHKDYIAPPHFEGADGGHDINILPKKA